MHIMFLVIEEIDVLIISYHSLDAVKLKQIIYSKQHGVLQNKLLIIGINVILYIIGVVNVTKRKKNTLNVLKQRI